MRKIARVGDQVEGTCDHGIECCPHQVTGQFVEGSKVMFIGNCKVVRKGDRCATNCPHCGTGVAHGTSKTVYCENKPVHLCGQAVQLGGGWGVSLDGDGTAFSAK